MAREACGQLRTGNQGLSSFGVLLTYYTVTYGYPGGGVQQAIWQQAIWQQAIAHMATGYMATSNRLYGNKQEAIWQQATGYMATSYMATG